MKEFKKNIYRTSVEDEIIPPSSFSYGITRGNQACIGGYVDINPIEDVGIYSTIIRSDWEIGTHLYINDFLTIDLPDGFYRSITGDTIDKFFFSIVSGIITEKILVATGC